MQKQWIYPDWPAPSRVRALSTTRINGVSRGVYSGLNLGSHVGDNAVDVAQNRTLLREELPGDPHWLKQTHGSTVAYADNLAEVVEADAAIARRINTVCAVMTADCLPVLLCADDASVVGAAHAGWRGLAAGVLEQVVDLMEYTPGKLMAWFGPAIGPAAFEVGADVRDIFVAEHPQSATAFKNKGGDKWLADIYALARLRLQRIGVTRIYGGEWCTYEDSQRFYSYRRDGVTGRMATLIWIADEN